MRSSLLSLLEVLLLLTFVLEHRECHAFSQKQKGDFGVGPAISRRDSWKVAVGVAGGVAYGKLIGDVLKRISRGIEFPPAHEERVEDTIATALAESCASFNKADDRPFRILEVGIGDDCRVTRRGLYNKGLKQLAESSKVSRIELTGVDLETPSDDSLRLARSALASRDSPTSVELDTLSGDITSGLPFPGGYFDSVICCLTLCSVTDQEAALQEMKRLTRPTGGTFGYVEHVAVEQDEPYRFLEWQQQVLDPIQQKVANNCHLHRYTEDAIATVFSNQGPSGVRIQHERFLVDEMWPVTCQSSGVFQMRA